MGSELERKLQQPISDEHARAILRQASERALERGENQLTGHHVRQAAIDALIPEADIDAVLNGYYFGSQPRPPAGSLRELITQKAQHLESFLGEFHESLPTGYNRYTFIAVPGTTVLDRKKEIYKEQRIVFRATKEKGLDSPCTSIHVHEFAYAPNAFSLQPKPWEISIFIRASVRNQSKELDEKMTFRERLQATKDILVRGQRPQAQLIVAETTSPYKITANSSPDHDTVSIHSLLEKSFGRPTAKQYEHEFPSLLQLQEQLNAGYYAAGQRLQP